MFSPPSTAPFMAPKTRAPVVVRAKPTSARKETGERRSSEADRGRLTQEAAEGSWSVLDRLHVEFLAGDLGASAVDRVETQFLQDSASHQQAGAVRRSVVGQTNLKQDVEVRFAVRFHSSDKTLTLTPYFGNSCEYAAHTTRSPSMRE